jgi:hypothetical protein
MQGGSEDENSGKIWRIDWFAVIEELGTGLEALANKKMRGVQLKLELVLGPTKLWRKGRKRRKSSTHFLNVFVNGLSRLSDRKSLNVTESFDDDYAQAALSKESSSVAEVPESGNTQAEEVSNTVSSVDG